MKVKWWLRWRDLIAWEGNSKPQRLDAVIFVPRSTPSQPLRIGWLRDHLNRVLEGGNRMW